jgi:hypothetical protein
MGWQPLTRQHPRCRNTLEIKGPFTQIFFSLSSFRARAGSRRSGIIFAHEEISLSPGGVLHLIGTWLREAPRMKISELEQTIVCE